MLEGFPAWWIALTMAFMPIAIWLFIKDRQRRNATVKKWALANNVTLVRRLHAWYRVSPFVMKELMGGAQRLEYWLVRDLNGSEHRVWLKIGNFFRGATEEIEDVWET